MKAPDASPQRVLIVGASGFLGANIALAASAGHTVFAHSSALPLHIESAHSVVANLLLHDSAERLVQSTSPHIVINCAALADIDACDRDPDLAHRLNTDLPGRLAIACRRSGAAMVHISTDAVFGGEPGPYTPTTRPSPINEYGRSKLAGETLVQEELPTALVVRTNIVGWSPTGRRSLLEFFCNRLSQQLPTPGFTDVSFRPVAASDVWSIIAAFLHDARSSGSAGVRHATGHTLLSKYAFGRHVAQEFGYDPALVQPASVGDAALTSRRAPSLDVLPSALPIDLQPLIPRLDLASTLSGLHALADDGYREKLVRMVATSNTTRNP